MKSQNPAFWEILGPNAAVQPGNVGNPSESTVTPWNSVISKRMYLRATLASKGGRFLHPKFAAMFK